MITFSKILHFSSNYKNRTKVANTLVISSFNRNIEQTNTQFNHLFQGNIGNHISKIKIIGSSLNNNTQVLFTCSCESFKYEFAYYVYKEKSLLDPENFILTKPIEKNKSGIAGPCKHIVFLANYIWSNKIKLKI